MCSCLLDNLYYFNPYPARTKIDYPLSPVESQTRQPSNPCSLTRLYFSNSHLESPKVDYGQLQKLKVDKSI